VLRILDLCPVPIGGGLGVANRQPNAAAVEISGLDSGHSALRPGAWWSGPGARLSARRIPLAQPHRTLLHGNQKEVDKTLRIIGILIGRKGVRVFHICVGCLACGAKPVPSYACKLMSAVLAPLSEQERSDLQPGLAVPRAVVPGCLDTIGRLANGPWLQNRLKAADISSCDQQLRRLQWP
jgi:hypothetical protein